MQPTSDMYLNRYTAETADFMQREADTALQRAAEARRREQEAERALNEQRAVTNKALRTANAFLPLDPGVYVHSPEAYETYDRLYDAAAAKNKNRDAAQRSGCGPKRTRRRRNELCRASGEAKP